MMSLASVLGGAALIVMGAWTHPAAYVGTWLALGAAMAGLLYEHRGQAAVGAVAVSWSCTEAFCTVTWVRRTRRVGGNRRVANLWSAWLIIPYDTVFRHPRPPLSPKMTLTQDVLT